MGFCAKELIYKKISIQYPCSAGIFESLKFWIKIFFKVLNHRHKFINDISN